MRLVPLLIGALLLAGCSAPAAAPTTATRTVDVGSGPVEVPVAPKRIAVLSGSLAGTFFALDAPVAGTDTSVLGLRPDASGFPSTWAAAAVRQGTVVLSKGGKGMNIEAIAALRPDLIVGGGQGITAVQAEQVLDKLKAIAPTVLVPRTVNSWERQLELIADVVGTADKVPGLLDAYRARVAEVRAAITPPGGPVAILYASNSGNGKLYMVPETAAYPRLLQELGFTLDPVVQKAGTPRLVSTGDAFEVSPELLAGVADAPNLQVIDIGGPKLDQLRTQPVIGRLPAVSSRNVVELPPFVYRADYPAVLLTLDELEKAYRRAA